MYNKNGAQVSTGPWRWRILPAAPRCTCTPRTCLSGGVMEWVEEGGRCMGRKKWGGNCSLREPAPPMTPIGTLVHWDPPGEGGSNTSTQEQVAAAPFGTKAMDWHRDPSPDQDCGQWPNPTARTIQTPKPDHQSNTQPPDQRSLLTSEVFTGFVWFSKVKRVELGIWIMPVFQCERLLAVTQLHFDSIQQQTGCHTAGCCHDLSTRPAFRGKATNEMCVFKVINTAYVLLNYVTVGVTLLPW